MEIYCVYGDDDNMFGNALPSLSKAELCASQPHKLHDQVQLSCNSHHW